ncbi:MAG: Ryanodine receptor Ryr [Clostridia bacterium]|nr:Ryanodine receptor Ryr [Oscillospiraceae bacterium]MBQ7960214.1 Ryanodine receptor Ryr [Clostridia bacterium]
MYKPEPIDTKDIELDGELMELMEKIAKHVHEVWAEGRIAEGWKYGTERNDRKKETPCLVPYDELPEKEKDYDRKTATETLRLIIKMGYRLEK